MCSKDLIDPNYFWKKRVNHINEMSACLTNPVYCNIKRYFIFLFLLYCLKTLFFFLPPFLCGVDEADRTNIQAQLLSDCFSSPLKGYLSSAYIGCPLKRP